MGRAPCCDKAKVKRGPWSPEEDAKLKAYVVENGNGGNWIALPRKIGLKRCGKSCRLRWLNYLRPNIKHGGFSEEEDNIICNLYISIGSRWSIIATQLPGRTDNDIKNYWNTRLKKKLLGRRKQSHGASMQNPRDWKSDEVDGHSQALIRCSALGRLQLHKQRIECLQSPFPFHTHPTLWPKLLPLPERIMTHRLQCNGSTNPGRIEGPLIPQQVPPSLPLPLPPSAMLAHVHELDGVENAFNGMSSNKAVHDCGQQVRVEAFQPELEELATKYRKAVDGFSSHQGHTAELDCSKGMVNESNMWRCNEFSSKLSSWLSSLSWDSISSGLDESAEGMMI